MRNFVGAREIQVVFAEFIFLSAPLLTLLPVTLQRGQKRDTIYGTISMYIVTISS